MKPATLTLLPDDLTGTIRLLRMDSHGKAVQATTSLSRIRSGEDGFVREGVRRYEVPPYPSADPANLISRRVILSDDGAADVDRLPFWARQAVALHPDRHDIARWLRAARQQAPAPWVSHLPIVLRDALRQFSEHPPLTMVLPDRAFLAATDDDLDTVGQISDAFTADAHEIDENSHRTGAVLAPMPLASDRRMTRRSGLATRAQTVIAEALMNGHDASVMPQRHDIVDRWRKVVDSDHAGRLRQISETEWVAPVAILDDHRDQQNRATLILATVHIVLSDKGRDLWMEYHEAVEVNASRPLRVDLEARLRVGSDASLANRKAMLHCIASGALPVLELSTRNDGEFDNRRLMEAVTDAVPLLRDHPGYSFPEAAMAFQRFRSDDPVGISQFATTRIPFVQRPAKEVAAGDGGETDPKVAETDQKVANQPTPPKKEIAPETDGNVGEVEKDAPEASITKAQKVKWMDALLARTSDGDTQHVREIRSRVELLIESGKGPAGLLALPGNDLLQKHSDMVSMVMYRVENSSLTTPRSDTRKQMVETRELFEAEAVWLRLLLAHNIAGLIERERITRSNAVTNERVSQLAKQVMIQLKATNIPVPAPPRSGEQNAPSQQSPAAGGANG